MIKLSKSNYHYALKIDDTEEKDLEKEILKIRKANPNYGYRPMTGVLRQQGRIINGKRVLRIMKELDILVTSYSRKSRKYNSYKGNVGIVAKHLLRRRFDTSIPRQKLTTDTT